ncbi:MULTISPECIES: LpqB family beta-propeller domain-containing protein [Cryobacterium]|uniref:GerMN domain-containing protein n=1 Tax=Cryobacterium breve TaxID=1259258 RepID=A0ABY2J140_9MICO|nr:MULTISPECIES: LpqB family beta-propeller domain-containing protein [Cryobacterium]TFC94122.1 hypothetical protein E3T20_09145 [Cryobacterium sp. TmT3-12]TFC98647.1 hypothetical protein E3O65_07145 [Cryobacterium breve]
MRRRARMVAGLVALAVALTGCSGIPRDGGVREGQTVQPGTTPAPVFLPSRPQKDATPEAILRGFIDAATSPDDDYAIAREFLAPSFSTSWEPDSGVTVDDATGRSIVAVGEEQMQFSVNPVAEVDARGEYREVESSTAVALRYQFVKVGGQWRIGAAPNGTVIDRNIFQDVFTSQALYFFDPGYSYLVPDLRWYPRGGATLTKIVNGLLEGPSPWLAGAVVTAFPEGTTLTADAVQVIARDAKVDLNSEALNADRVTLQRMKAQLSASLPAGLSATVTINRNMQDIGELTANAPAVNPRVDARALILRDGEFGFLAASGSSVTPIAGLSGSVSDLSPLSVTLSPGQTAAAVLTGAGVFGVRVGDDPVLLDPRQGLIGPSIDNYGFVWSLPADRPGELFVYGPNGDATAVPTPWPEASAIRSLRVSRDGARLIALLQSGADSRFVVAAITRDETTPVALGDAVLLSQTAGVAVDAAWIDELTVASLTLLPTGEERIVALQLGGLSSRLESAPNSLTIVGSNNLRDLRALSSTGGLLVQRGAGWQERLGGVGLLATQQGIGG